MAERLRCEQCGREGTRGFRVIPAVKTPVGRTPAITVCANPNACRKRWPKVYRDDE